MRLGIVTDGGGLGAARAWQQEAPDFGYEVVFNSQETRRLNFRRLDVLCVFGSPFLMAQLVGLYRTLPRGLVWWCAEQEPSAIQPRLERFVAPLTRLRASAQVEVLAATPERANTLAASHRLQATVVPTNDQDFSKKLNEACRRATGQLPSSVRDPFVPREAHVLPYSVPHDVPGFTIPDAKRTFAFAPQPIQSEAWFQAFADRVESAIGREFLPVCRMSDGEYLFRFGWQPHLSTEPAWRRVGAKARHALLSLRPQRGFHAGHRGRYQSARYTLDEQREGLAKFDSAARHLTKNGVLALHLSHEEHSFQERFYPSVASWLRELDLPLNTDNYVPFYFVYALLTGPARHAILSDRTVLVINGSTGEKRERIIAGLLREGARAVHWEPISPARSLFDKIDVSAWRGKVDLALIGAGVGKVNILPQLEQLEVPCVDAGYVFEVWADPQSSRERFYCTPDDTRPH